MRGNGSQVLRVAIVKTRTSSHVFLPNHQEEPISDEDLIREFLLDLRPSDRYEKDILIYGDSAKRLSAFGREPGFPPLALMNDPPEWSAVADWLSRSIIV